MSEFATQWIELARRVARFTASDFPDIDADDIEGQLLVFLAERKLFDTDPETDGYAYALNRKAHYFAWEERKEHLILSPQYAYRTRDVSMLLENLFDYSRWAEASVPDDAKSFENSHATDGIEMTSDLSRAYDLLPENYKRAVYARYALGEIPPRGTSEAKLLNRAKARMAEVLNTYHRPEKVGPGSRRVVSNARSRYELDSG